MLHMRKFRFLIDYLIESKRKVQIFLLTLPIVVLVIFFSILDLSRNTTFFLAIFLSNYFIGAFTLYLVLNRAISPKTSGRSPLYFIKNLHTTDNKDYWDESQQRLRHLVGAEIGVYRGKNARSILEVLNIKQLVLVDAWKGYVDVRTGVEFTDSFFENLYQEVKRNFSYMPNVQIIRDMSVNAANAFDDNYFDFVYLDGDHGYEAVRDDLEAWYPKLKKWGVMCGDDYGHPSGLGVIEAGSEFAFEKRLLVTTRDDSQFWFVKVE